MVKYIEDQDIFKGLDLANFIVDNPLWYHKKGLSQTATGYGKKLTTTKMLLIGKRRYRIYCSCFSNCGSCYVLIKNERYYLKYSY